MKEAIVFAGDIVVIHLGINDTDPRDWPNYRDFFINDYRALIDSFRVANPKCRILIARLTPIADRHPRFESGTRDWHGEIQLRMEKMNHCILIRSCCPMRFIPMWRELKYWLRLYMKVLPEILAG